MHHMARDVDAALHAVIERESGCSSEQAMTYVTQMKQDKRYVRDVY
jgi:sulfite reductase (NADPH) flavoprotein alpha-component